MAFVADIVSVNTFCFALFFGVTNKTLHHLVLFEIYQRFFAHDTFFFHNITIFMLAYNKAKFNTTKARQIALLLFYTIAPFGFHHFLK